MLFVADEIQTGFARTGDVFALDHEGVRADLVTVAKGLADGMPLAAVIGRAELMDAVHAGGLGGTYGGNPVACAAALAAMDVLVEEDLVGRARWIASVVRPALERAQAEHPSIGDVRGRGAMMAIEFVRPAPPSPTPLRPAGSPRACHAAGVVVLTCGTYGNVIRLLPPLVITEDLLRDGLDVLVGRDRRRRDTRARRHRGHGGVDPARVAALHAEAVRTVRGPAAALAASCTSGPAPSMPGGVPMSWMVKWPGPFPTFVERAPGRALHLRGRHRPRRPLPRRHRRDDRALPRRHGRAR